MILRDPGENSLEIQYLKLQIDNFLETALNSNFPTFHVFIYVTGLFCMSPTSMRTS
jgi:hypothetical protein